MTSEWLGTSGEEIMLVVVSTVGILAITTAVIRVVGLRSLSKMSSGDFVVTVAMGSIVATVAATSASLWHGGLALGVLLGTQWLIALGRQRFGLGRVVDNTPLLLMEGPRILSDNLRTSQVTKDDLIGKLREANVTRFDQVLAVVLETTGDISVLHGEGPLEDGLLDGVRRR